MPLKKGACVGKWNLPHQVLPGTFLHYTTHTTAEEKEGGRGHIFQSETWAQGFSGKVTAECGKRGAWVGQLSNNLLWSGGRGRSVALWKSFLDSGQGSLRVMPGGCCDDGARCLFCCPKPSQSKQPSAQKEDEMENPPFQSQNGCCMYYTVKNLPNVFLV